MSSTTAGERPYCGEVRGTDTPDLANLTDPSLHADTFDVAQVLANLVAGQLPSQFSTVQEAQALLTNTAELIKAVEDGRLQPTRLNQRTYRSHKDALGRIRIAGSPSDASDGEDSSQQSAEWIVYVQILDRWKEQGVFDDPPETDLDSPVPDETELDQHHQTSQRNREHRL